MNFQTVSTAEKLPTSDGLTGGYLPDGTPGPLVQRSLDYVNVILSAKHGQSPTNPTQLTRIDDGPLIDALNAAWRTASPSDAKPLVAFSLDDDGILFWLNNRTPAAEVFAKQFLLGYSGTGSDISGNPKPFTSAGLRQVYAGSEAAQLIGVPESDPRVPDVIGLAQVGTVYTGGNGKIAEHGGGNPQDRAVPLVVAGPSVASHRVVGGAVETTQIAPTILRQLGLDPSALQAVRIEHTQALPVR